MVICCAVVSQKMKASVSAARWRLWESVGVFNVEQAALSVCVCVCVGLACQEVVLMRNDSWKKEEKREKEAADVLIRRRNADVSCLERARRWPLTFSGGEIHVCGMKSCKNHIHKTHICVKTINLLVRINQESVF